MNLTRQTAKVLHLQRDGILLVEDGNHGENRPLSHEFDSKGVPFVRPPDLVGGRVLFDQCDRINGTARQRVRKGIGRGGDILFTHRATVGRMALTHSGDPEFVANPGVTVWRCLKQNHLDRQYLYYWMHTPEFMSQVWAVAGSSDTFPYFSLIQQRELSVSWPGIDEQRAIAAVLDALDDKIELNWRMNETLEAMARAIFKDWFVDFGPTRAKMANAKRYLAPDLWSLFPARLAGNGLPEGWVPSAIGAEVEVVGGSTPSTKEPAFWTEAKHCWATPKDLSPLSHPVLLDTERRISDAGLAGISSGLLPEGTVLLSSRAPVGYLAIAEVPTAINQGFIAMRCNGAISNLFALLWCGANMDVIIANANGSTFQEISKSNFRPIGLIRPSRELLKAFDDLAMPLYKRLVANVREIATLAATRDLLLPKLMSGEIRIKDAEKLVGTVA